MTFVLKFFSFLRQELPNSNHHHEQRKIYIRILSICRNAKVFAGHGAEAASSLADRIEDWVLGGGAADNASYLLRYSSTVMAMSKTCKEVYPLTSKCMEGSHLRTDRHRHQDRVINMTLGHREQQAHICNHTEDIILHTK